MSHDRIICTIGNLAAGASFAVTVSATIPAGFIQIPPSPAEMMATSSTTPRGRERLGGLPSSIFNRLSNPRIGLRASTSQIVRMTTSFGQGAKEDTPFPTVVSGSIPNNKSDLRRFYVASERFGTTDFLYFAWSARPGAQRHHEYGH